MKKRSLLMGLIYVELSVIAFIGAAFYSQYIDEFGAGVPIEAENAQQSTRTYRYLHNEEIEFAKEVFGDQINYEEIRIVYHKLQIENNSNTPEGYNMVAYVPGNREKLGIRGNDIHMGPMVACDNYASGDCDEYSRSVFMHEMTHIYQNQHDGRANRAIRNDRDYSDKLEQNVPFVNYGIEEQSELVEAYVRTCILYDYGPDMFTEHEVGQIVRGAQDPSCISESAEPNVATVLGRHFNISSPRQPTYYRVISTGPSGTRFENIGTKPSKNFTS